MNSQNQNVDSANPSHYTLLSDIGSVEPSALVGLRLRLDPVFPKWFLRKYRVSLSGCWIWTGWLARNPFYPEHAYGYTKYVDDNGKRRSMAAHRFAYALVKGPIPSGMDVDHLCQNKLCVNPDHLEAVTHQVNCQRIPRELRDRTKSAEQMSRLKIEWWAARRSK